MGTSVLAPIEIPSEDRNRTSPFPYGGHRFEFRAVGSSQNVSMVNTVLATITAKAFKEFADAIEKVRSTDHNHLPYYDNVLYLSHLSPILT